MAPRPTSTIFTVNTTDDHDDGSCDALDCTLREAINTANSNAGADTINFSMTGKINLLSALPDITDDVAINGPGASQLMVQRSTAIGTPAFPIFLVQTNGTVIVSGLTVSNGGGTGTAANSLNGGGIFNRNAGTVNVIHSNVIDNVSNYGGGIYNFEGTLNVIDSTISGNSTRPPTDETGGGSGGGIYNYNGNVNVTNSTISGNSSPHGGGGIFHYRGIVNVTNSIISRDSAIGNGGGIHTNDNGTVNVINSTISGNSSRGDGGGIFQYSGTVSVTNSTISGNSATFGGGGINNYAATVNLHNSIIGLNTASNGPDLRGTATSQGHNVVGTTSGAGIAPQIGDQFGVTAAQLNLGHLTNNGGSTQTIALLCGSVAIDAGDDSVLNPPLSFSTDQRGNARKFGTHVDIGAFELQTTCNLTPTPTLAYVANSCHNTVSAMDTATNTVVATIPVGSSPQGVAVTRDGTRAYVTNHGSDTVSVIDTATNTVVATIPVGSAPFGVAITPDGTRAYVTNTGSSTVSVIDTATNTVVATIPDGFCPFGIAITPDGKRAYAANWCYNFVSVIDTATNTVVATINVASEPFGVAITPDGTRAYVTNRGSNLVAVIDTATNTVVAAVAVGSAPQVVAITPDGTRAYVPNGDSNTVSVIDTATNSVITTINVGSEPNGVAITPDGTRAYVTNDNSFTVSVIDTATNTVVATIPGFGCPYAIAIAIAPAPTPTPTCGTDTPRITSLPGTPGCVAPPANLINWWPGDGNANDIFGTNNGTLQGGATFAPGKVGQAFSFDGVSAYVSTDHNVLSTPTELTMDAWVKPDAQSANRRRILSVKGFYVISLDLDGTVECIADGEEQNTFAHSSKSIIDGSFHHVACTNDGSTTRLYVDGVPDGTVSETIADINSFDRNIIIGNNVEGRDAEFYKGLIDEVEIFNRALTPAEIQSIVHADSAGKCKGVVVNNDPDRCSAVVNFAAPTATDNCPSITVATSPASGSVFPVGTTPVTVTATDVAGNSSFSKFTVTVLDAQPPRPDAPSLPDVTGECSANLPAPPTATDACDGRIVGAPDKSGPFGQGDDTITWTFTDRSGNRSTETQAVHVHDATAPVPDSRSLPDVTGQCSANLPPPPTATDACDGRIVGVPDKTGPFGQGDNTITWTFTDRSGNRSTETQAVHVHDTTAPVPDAPSLPDVTGQCSADLPAAPIATDACDGRITGVPDKRGPFGQGDDTITWTFTDRSGNRSTETQAVHVHDTKPPVPDLRALPDVTGECSATLPATPTATDACNGTITGVPDQRGPFTEGDYTITWTFTDRHVNQSTQTQMVHVHDTTPPTITAPADVVVNAGASCMAIGVALGSPTVADNCSGIGRPANNAPASFPLGVTTVTWSVSDAHGHTSTATQKVTVIDTTPPQITCPWSITVETCDAIGAVVSFPTPTATDNCGVASVIASPASGSTFPIAVTTVTATAIDAAGNRSTCSFTVTVLASRGTKQNVLDELKALRATVTNKDDREKLDLAILRLATSLNPQYWIDETHVKPQYGDKVLDQEQNAVAKLRDLIKHNAAEEGDKHDGHGEGDNSDDHHDRDDGNDRKDRDHRASSIPEAILRGFISRIVCADRILAQVAINDAVSHGGDAKGIAKAKTKLANGDHDALKNKYEGAIEDYEEAWRVFNKKDN